ncbi:MAG: cation transporter [Planctomycetales bacterium]|nr:cation transporter [Planctomycetales bacterium]
MISSRIRTIGLLLVMALAGNHAASLLAATNNPPQGDASKAIAIYVKDMHCGGCANKISSKLYTVKGVAKVTTDLNKHVAVVYPSQQQNPSLKSLWEAVEAVQFEPVKLVANKQVYTKKPTNR